jgi:hypothetical protein
MESFWSSLGVRTVSQNYRARRWRDKSVTVLLDATSLPRGQLWATISSPRLLKYDVLHRIRKSQC